MRALKLRILPKRGCSLHLQYFIIPLNSFLIDDTSDMLYIILDGSVDVSIDLRKRNINDNDLKEMTVDLELSQSLIAMINKARM